MQKLNLCSFCDNIYIFYWPDLEILNQTTTSNKLLTYSWKVENVTKKGRPTRTSFKAIIIRITFHKWQTVYSYMEPSKQASPTILWFLELDQYAVDFSVRERQKQNGRWWLQQNTTFLFSWTVKEKDTWVSSLPFGIDSNDREHPAINLMIRVKLLTLSPPPPPPVFKGRIDWI